MVLDTLLLLCFGKNVAKCVFAHIQLIQPLIGLACTDIIYARGPVRMWCVCVFIRITLLTKSKFLRNV